MHIKLYIKCIHIKFGFNNTDTISLVLAMNNK